MLQTSFTFRCGQHQVIDMDWVTATKTMIAMGEGDVFFRQKQEWTVDRMRKYLHGPLTNFLIIEWEKKHGSVKTTTQMHRFLREAFLPGTPMEVNGILIPDPVSETTLDVIEYHAWLQKIKKWCWDHFNCEMPIEGQIEKAE